MSLSPEELAERLEALESQVNDLKTENETLERSKSGLQRDLARKKSLARILTVAGINPDADDAEDQIAAALARSSAGGGGGQPSSGTGDTGAPPKQPAPQGTPADAMEGAIPPAVAAELSSLKAKVTTLETDKKTERDLREKAEEREREGRKRAKIMELLAASDCPEDRRADYYRLEGHRFFAEPDGDNPDEIVLLYGSQDNPSSAITAQLALERAKDGVLHYFWNQPQLPTSPRLTPPSSTNSQVTPSSSNPFLKGASGTGNATEVAALMERDPSRARKLAQAAMAKGDGLYDPRLVGVAIKR